MIITLYFVYFYLEYVRAELSDHMRPVIVTALNDPSTATFVPLSRLAWYTTATQDFFALIFIVVCIHLLRLMRELPGGVGPRVMAILKVISHPYIQPFYLVLSVMIVSFSIGLHFAFADEMLGYRTMIPSIFASLLAAFGDFGIGLDEMFHANEWFTYVVVILMMTLVSLLMMNIFIAVVGNVYELAEEQSLAEYESELDYHIKSLFDDNEIENVIKLQFQQYQEVLENEEGMEREENIKVSKLPESSKT